MAMSYSKSSKRERELSDSKSSKRERERAELLKIQQEREREGGAMSGEGERVREDKWECE